MVAKSRISIIGLGKLGMPIAAAIASRGLSVIGVDTRKEIISALNSGKINLTEKQFSSYLIKYKKRIRATNDYSEAIHASGITFVIVPTPSRSDGTFSNKYVLDVVKRIGIVLKTKSSFHTISIVSTVVPGSMEKEILSILENSSGKRIGQDFGLCYNPTFVALGNVIKNFLYPDFVLIGESDKKSGDTLSTLYKKMCRNKPKIQRMNFVNAEITKLALNTYVTTKISYANMLSQLCEKIPDANVDIVTTTLGHDSRIGHKYLKGATAYGGPCFPRDNKALTATGKKYSVDLVLPQATDITNTKQINRLVSLAKKHTSIGEKIAILGITYRSGSDVVEGSLGLKLAQALMKNYRVAIYDPIGLPAARLILKRNVLYAQSLKSALKNVDSIIITTDVEEFTKISVSIIPSKKPFLIDCWRIINSPKIQSMVQYYPLGIGLSR